MLIVIAGDTYYRDETEQEQCVISRWTRRKVASQFNEEYLDGRKSFILSWNSKHRTIHEEALLHFFDPKKEGQKFQYQPKPKPIPEPPVIPSVAPPREDHEVWWCKTPLFFTFFGWLIEVCSHPSLSLCSQLSLFVRNRENISLRVNAT